MTRVAGAQSTMLLGDSLTRRIAAQSTDTVFISMRDADYAHFVLTHRSGLTATVIKPNGALVRSWFVNPQMQGSSLIVWVAEGAGKYGITIASGDSAAQYDLVFRQWLSLDERTRPVPKTRGVSSPTIDAMRRQVDSGITNTTAFWRAVAERGTPLVEPLDANYDLVTFLWRAEGDTRNAFAIAHVQVPEGPNDAMQQLGSTDIWYLTLPLPKGARFAYQMEPNRPTNPSAIRVTRQLDPLNRGVRWACPAGASKYRCWSIAELPGADPQEWIVKRSGVPTGRIERHKIHSALQAVDRDITVYTPAGYSAAGPQHPVVILFDGEDYLLPEWGGLNTWDNLIAAKKIPPTVVVMVHNLPGRRLFDLIANRTFGDFMAKELVPWVQKRYNVSRRPARIIVGGFSAGGFTAAYLGLTHPKVFGNVLSMSPAVWWSPEHNDGICGGLCADPSGRPAVSNLDSRTEPNWIAHLALEKPRANVRFFLSAGVFEFDGDGTGGGNLEETRHLRDILRAKNYDVIYHQPVAGHHQLNWRGELADGLQSLLGAPR